MREPCCECCLENWPENRMQVVNGENGPEPLCPNCWERDTAWHKGAELSRARIDELEAELDRTRSELQVVHMALRECKEMAAFTAKMRMSG